MNIDAAILAHDHTAGGFGAFVPSAAVWLAMMAAMMAPTAWPWVLAFERFAVGETSRFRRTLATAAFSTGYLAAWGLYAIAASALQLALSATGVLDASQGTSSVVGAGILIVAGTFQFAPLKRACLTHCRNPFSYLLTRWSNGPANGFRLGLGHGLFCVGCCWALMTTAFAVGVMNLWWMAALTLAVFVEQVVPRGELLRAPLGIALIAAGCLRALGALNMSAVG